MEIEKPWYKRWWVIALLLFTILIILGSLNSEKGRERENKVTVVDPALVMMQDGLLLKIRTENKISELLKTPSVAKFTTSVGDLKFESGPAFKGKNKYGKDAPIVSMYSRKVYGYVDSQNSFGAMIRIQFEMEFLLDKSKPSIVVGVLKIEGETYGCVWK